MTDPINITVVTDVDGEQAAYVEGELEERDGTYYAWDLADLAQGRPINLTAVSIDFYYDGWPKTLSELNTHLKVYDPT